MRFPKPEIVRFSRPSDGMTAAVLIPMYAAYSFVLRGRYRRFRAHPEAAARFNTTGERVKLLLVPIGYTVIFVGLAALDGYLLR
jgi:hypothetical protein